MDNSLGLSKDSEIYEKANRHPKMLLNEQGLKDIFESIMQDEISQSLRPNSFTPEQDIQQMRLFYFDRVAEILRDEVILELQEKAQRKPPMVQQDQDIIQELVINKLKADLENEKIGLKQALEKAKQAEEVKEFLELEYKQELKQLNIQNEELKNQVRGISEQDVSQNEKIQKLVKELQIESENRQKLQQESFEQNLTIKKLESEKDSLEREIAKKQTNSNTEFSKYQAYGEQLRSVYESKLQEMLGQYTQKLQQGQKQLMKYKEKEEKMEKENKEMKKRENENYKNYRDQIDKMEMQICQKENEYNIQKKKYEVENTLKLKNSQRDFADQIYNLKQIIDTLNIDKNDLNRLVQEKQEMIDELESEIEDFTNNVQQNMIKICDHEDIMNQEILNLQSQHNLRFQVYQSQNQNEIDLLFDQMKQQYEEQIQIKDLDTKNKINDLMNDNNKKESKLKEKVKQKDQSLEQLQTNLSKIQSQSLEQIQQLKHKIKEMEFQNSQKSNELISNLESLTQKNNQLNNQLQNQIDENLSLQEKQLKSNQKYEEKISQNQHSLKKMYEIIMNLRNVSKRQLKCLKDEMIQTQQFTEIYSKRAIEEQKMQLVLILDKIKENKPITQSLKKQKQEFKRLFSLVKSELHQKYSQKLQTLSLFCKNLKVHFDTQIIQMQKDLKKLHIQHQLEKEGLQEQFSFIYGKYKEKKEEIKILNNLVEKEKKISEGQKKIYEKLLVESMSNTQKTNELDQTHLTQILKKYGASDFSQSMQPPRQRSISPTPHSPVGVIKKINNDQDHFIQKIKEEMRQNDFSPKPINVFK